MDDRKKERDEFDYLDIKTTMHYSHEDNVYHGKLKNIKDLVSFHSDDRMSFEEAFHEAVDAFSHYNFALNGVCPVFLHIIISVLKHSDGSPLFP